MARVVAVGGHHNRPLGGCDGLPRLRRDEGLVSEPDDEAVGSCVAGGLDGCAQRRRLPFFGTPVVADGDVEPGLLQRCLHAGLWARHDDDGTDC